jgi:hypothetical protein
VVPSRAWLISGVLIGLLLTPSSAAGANLTPPNVTADPCPEPNDAVTSACQLGQPNAVGITVQGLFNNPADVDVYRFDVPAPGAQAHITLTDLWSEGDLRLFDITRGAFIAEADRLGSALGQFRAPGAIVRWLEPGSYSAFVESDRNDWTGAAAHSYTLRVALGPRAAPAAGPAPYPASAGGYQLTLSIEPSDPGPFSLMTFTATIDPPFTDLFDFSWSVDGQPLGDNANAVQFGRPSGGSHTVLVIARGARPYPDPSAPGVPPTLSANGTFEVQ